MQNSSGHPMRETIGLSAALSTPLDSNGAIDWPLFGRHARRLLDGGMKVVTAFGTTGEGVSLPSAERAELYGRMAEAGISAQSLVECVYGPSSIDAGLHLRRSLAAGCRGILLTPPFYFKEPTEEGVHRWFAEAFQTAGGGCRDIILYNIPALTGVRIGPALVSRLRRDFPEAIAGVKDSSGDWEQTTALIKEHRDLAILVGHEGHLAKAVRLGASGAISGIANFAPGLVGQLTRGEDNPLIDGVLSLLLSLPVVPAIKAILAAQHGEAGWSRTAAPLQPIASVRDLATSAEIAAMVA